MLRVHIFHWNLVVPNDSCLSTVQGRFPYRVFDKTPNFQYVQNPRTAHGVMDLNIFLTVVHPFFASCKIFHGTVLWKDMNN